jgi:HAD superfamily hydrolase (TIGR01662 family)
MKSKNHFPGYKTKYNLTITTTNSQRLPTAGRTPMQFSTILFDLGSTLVYSKDPWPSFYQKADRALVDALCNAGFEIDASTFFTENGGFIHAYYDKRFEDNLEPTSFTVLQELLSRKGFQDVPDAVLRTALEELYAITDQNWIIEEDAIPTLESLKLSGYRLGLISNTSDDTHVQHLLDKNGLRPFFESVLTSAALGIRKPDQRIFQIALDHFQVQPDAVVMVGDTLDADVLGANQSGIYSIWITRRALVPSEGELAIQPQAVVSALSQIPGLLAEVEKERTQHS